MCTFNSYSFNNTHVKQPIVKVVRFLFSLLLFFFFLIFFFFSRSFAVVQLRMCSHF